MIGFPLLLLVQRKARVRHERIKNLENTLKGKVRRLTRAKQGKVRERKVGEAEAEVEVFQKKETSVQSRQSLKKAIESQCSKYIRIFNFTS
jgi:hypothetical protein